MMEWEKLLKLERLNDPNYILKKHRPTYSQDMDRILFSPPFRRLANKTQVHPLYDNDHLHQRLTHSLEVTRVGRSLGIEVGDWLAEERGDIPGDQVHVVAGLVQTACMAHDIGNPPFGHSGEEAIASWFREKFSGSSDILNAVTLEQRPEFEAFEGNAQGFRILTRTEMYKNQGGMRLAMGSLGAFSKYPVSAWAQTQMGDQAIVDGIHYIGLKKYGLFLDDVQTFEHVAEQLGLPSNPLNTPDGRSIGTWWRRHPLAFLMEAADDICYNIMDLEDAYLAEDISFEQVISILEKIARKSNKSYPDQSEQDTISRYRALAISGAIEACVEAFKQNYEKIMAGTFSISLVDASRLAPLFTEIKILARNRIFTARRKTELEVYGRNIVYRILDGLLPLVDELVTKNGDVTKLSSYHTQVIRALNFPTDSLGSPYEALHSLTDFVSGMTDRYAVKVAEMLGR